MVASVGRWPLTELWPRLTMSAANVSVVAADAKMLPASQNGAGVVATVKIDVNQEYSRPVPPDPGMSMKKVGVSS